MKKLIAVAVSLAMMLSLCACANEKEDKPKITLSTPDDEILFADDEGTTSLDKTATEEDTETSEEVTGEEPESEKQVAGNAEPSAIVGDQYYKIGEELTAEQIEAIIDNYTFADMIIYTCDETEKPNKNAMSNFLPMGAKVYVNDNDFIGDAYAVLLDGSAGYVLDSTPFVLYNESVIAWSTAPSIMYDGVYYYGSENSYLFNPFTQDPNELVAELLEGAEFIGVVESTAFLTPTEDLQSNSLPLGTELYLKDDRIIVIDIADKSTAEDHITRRYAREYLKNGGNPTPETSLEWNPSARYVFSDPDHGGVMTLEESTSTSLKVKISDTSQYQLQSCDQFILQIKAGDSSYDWYDVYHFDHICLDEFELYSPGESVQYCFSWESLGELPAGTYRVAKRFTLLSNNIRTFDAACEFTVE